MVGVITLFLVLINTFFFESTVTFILKKVLTDKLNAEVSIESMSGSIFTGTARLNNVTFRGKTISGTTFDVFLRKVSVDLDMPTSLFTRITFENFYISDVSGTLNGIEKIKNFHSGRVFEINNLKLRNVIFRGRNSTNNSQSPALLLKIDNMFCKQFRSSKGFFDFFLKTNLTGRIMGCPFSIKNQRKGLMNESKWKIENLDLKFLNMYYARMYISQGSLDGNVLFSWEDGKEPGVFVNGGLVLCDLRFEILPGPSAFMSKYLFPVYEKLKERIGEFPINFKFAISEKDFSLAILRQKIAKSVLPDILQHCFMKTGTTLVK